MMRRPALSTLLLLMTLADLVAVGAAHAVKKKPLTAQAAPVIHATVIGGPDRQPEASPNPLTPRPITAVLEDHRHCPQAAVAFRNATKSELQLQIGSGAPAGIAAGARVVVCADDAIVAWQVVSPAGWRYGGRLDVTGLQLREETLIEPGGTLELVNATGEPQRLKLDGRDVGWLAPGKSRTLGPLDAGTHRVLGQGKVSRRKDARVVRVEAGVTTEVSWQPQSTWANIHNHAAEVAHLVIDGVGFGNIAPHTAVRIVGLNAGKHQAVLTLMPSGKEKRLEVTASAKGEAPGLSPEIELTLTNQTGELLNLPEGLRDWGRVIDVGATLSARVPRRRFGVDLRGQDSGLKYHLDIRGAAAPDALAWQITRPQANLRIHNALRQRIHVDLPAGASLDVDPGERPVVRVPAGQIRLTATATVPQPRSWSRGMTLPAGREALWEVKATDTALVVASGYSEPLWVRLDGVASVKLLPGKSMRLRARPGTHTLEARAPRSGTSAKVQVLVDDGERKTVTLKPPTGTLRLTSGALPVRVFVRGVSVADSQPGEVMAVPVAAGQVQAEVRDSEGHSSLFVGLVAPTQQVELALPSSAVAALEIGWQGPAAAQIAVDAGEPTTVPPGAILRLDAIARGSHLVAVSSGGVQWRRWVQVDGRQTVARVVLKAGE